ncbi:MAG: helix-turn-helix transcriptional regulator [Marmoricola sp.]
MTESGGPLGRFLREQRALARLSVREMARMAQVSNAYLSQVERGLHSPSLRVMRALAEVLEVPVEDLVHLSDSDAQRASSPTLSSNDVESAIKKDPRLAEAHKQALLAVYRSFVDKPPGE